MNDVKYGHPLAVLDRVTVPATSLSLGVGPPPLELAPTTLATFSAGLSPVHASYNVEATFDFVERIVQLVAFDNVASTLLLTWTELYTFFTSNAGLPFGSASQPALGHTWFSQCHFQFQPKMKHFLL